MANDILIRDVFILAACPMHFLFICGIHYEKLPVDSAYMTLSYRHKIDHKVLMGVSLIPSSNSFSRLSV